ncbi:hypothetical protein DFS33DRAFT_1386068 [Desarmillaria ectypa]|nr:hypothetical protein DFS33DRAFT_1386068 [Desarmillaria ectypa]
MFSRAFIFIAIVASALSVYAACTNYTVVAGDTFTSIAIRFGVTIAQLMAANPQITNPDALTVGQTQIKAPIMMSIRIEIGRKGVMYSWSSLLRLH